MTIFGIEISDKIYLPIFIISSTYAPNIINIGKYILSDIYLYLLY